MFKIFQLLLWRVAIWLMCSKCLVTFTNGKLRIVCGYNYQLNRTWDSLVLEFNLSWIDIIFWSAIINVNYLIEGFISIFILNCFINNLLTLWKIFYKNISKNLQKIILSIINLNIFPIIIFSIFIILVIISLLFRSLYSSLPSLFLITTFSIVILFFVNSILITLFNYLSVSILKFYIVFVIGR